MTKLKITKTELMNRKGEPNGRFRYEIRNPEGDVFGIRESRNNYISAARIYWMDGSVGDWVYSSKIFSDAKQVAAQMGYGPRLMSPGKYGWHSSAGRAHQRSEYSKWIKDKIAGVVIVGLSK